MESGNVVTVLALGDRHRVKMNSSVKMAWALSLHSGMSSQRIRRCASQGRQFSQLTLSCSCGIDPAQLHGQSPSTLFYTAPGNWGGRMG